MSMPEMRMPRKNFLLRRNLEKNQTQKGRHPHLVDECLWIISLLQPCTTEILIQKCITVFNFKPIISKLPTVQWWRLECEHMHTEAQSIPWRSSGRILSSPCCSQGSIPKQETNTTTEGLTHRAGPVLVQRLAKMSGFNHEVHPAKPVRKIKYVCQVFRMIRCGDPEQGASEGQHIMRRVQARSARI